MPQATPTQNKSKNQMANVKTNVTANWWAPLWRGLIVDETAKHYHTMRNAVWLYLYLLLFAKRSTGIVRRQLSTIAAHTGIKPRTLQRYLSVLRKAGYVTVENAERVFILTIEKWKPIHRRTPFSINQQKEKDTFQPRPEQRQLRSFSPNGQNSSYRQTGSQRTLFH